MDGDVAVEPEVDSFSLILPLPYRVAIIIVLGMTIQGRSAEPFVLMRHRHMGLGTQPALPTPREDCTLIVTVRPRASN